MNFDPDNPETMPDAKTKKNKDGLLPCPFCGRYPKIGSLGGDKQNWAIWCECQIPCAETGLSGETKEDIITVWNKRIALTITNFLAVDNG